MNLLWAFPSDMAWDKAKGCPLTSNFESIRLDMSLSLVNDVVPFFFSFMSSQNVNIKEANILRDAA